ncbi:HlyD family secretion protein [Mesorhizobium soli]|uniref:NHLP bacteriocin system secretion protein n=1 Tax=Pseudaminobacter soli (ex Li et al. 2025) TaxID=1295366 RepID=UPI0024756318|nr:NHLP bacteriocin system secretion protein [Mesorhizobium soli]MDH6233111.1 HlyD family secretion protein [Mesorhizobium soli]
MNNQKSNLYRQEALDRLSSPEQLDEAIVITGSGSWAALLGLLILLATATAWAFTASIPTRIEGQGILFSGGGQMVDAISTASGKLLPVGQLIGGSVRKGDVLAEIDQPDASAKLALAKAQAEAAKEALQALRREQKAVADARLANAEARKASLEVQMRAAEQRRTVYEQFVGNQEKLAAGGVTTALAVQQTREQLASATLDIATARTGLLAVAAEQFAAESEDQRRFFEQNQKVLAADAEVKQLDLQLSLFGKVTSPADGTLVEWKAPFGAFTPSGTRVASVAAGEGSLQFMLYVPPAQGKRIKAGMPVNVELGGLEKENWGTLVGRILSVSEFPSTPEGMQAVLQNDVLVTRFAKEGAPFAAVVELERDETTASGYRWSGGTGASAELSAGTTGTAKVTVDSRTPVSFLLPLLRKALGA